MSRPTCLSARPPGLCSGTNDPGPVELLRLVCRCERQLRRMLAERVGRWAVSEVELLVLSLCCEASEPGTAQHELVAMVGVSAAQMSGLVERLRGRGLLAARRCEQDRRRQYWNLTVQGRRLLDGIRADLAPVSLALTKHLPGDEQMLLGSLLKRLTSAAEQPPTLRAVAADTNQWDGHREVHDEDAKNDN